MIRVCACPEAEPLPSLSSSQGEQQGCQKDKELNEAWVKILGCAHGSQVSCPRLTRAGSLEQTQALLGGRKCEIGLECCHCLGFLAFFSLFWGHGRLGGKCGAGPDAGMVGEGITVGSQDTGDAQGSGGVWMVLEWPLSSPSSKSLLPISSSTESFLLSCQQLPSAPPAQGLPNFPYI